MKYFLPPALILAFGLAVHQSEVPEVGLDWGPLTLHEREIEIDLDGQLSAVLARIHERQEIVEQLVAGRMSLSEAAERFRELNRAERDCHRLLPGNSEEEKLYRQVIHWVSHSSKALAAQFEGELEEILRGGSVDDAD